MDSLVNQLFCYCNSEIEMVRLFVSSILTALRDTQCLKQSPYFHGGQPINPDYFPSPPGPGLKSNGGLFDAKNGGEIREQLSIGSPFNCWGSDGDPHTILSNEVFVNVDIRL